MGIVSEKLRNSAKGQHCTLRTPWCNHDPETTVLCHLNSTVKGMGNKGDDFFAVFGCHACHEAIDQHRIEGHARSTYMINALQETHRRWFEMGLLQVPVTEKRRVASSKILPRRDMRKSA